MACKICGKEYRGPYCMDCRDLARDRDGKINVRELHRLEWESKPPRPDGQGDWLTATVFMTTGFWGGRWLYLANPLAG